MRIACLPILCRLASFLAGIALAVGLVPPLAAQESATAIVVFDGSGSMWGKLDGERNTKLVIGREAVRTGLQRIAPETRVGLMSFGHRRAGDCQDTETVIEPGPLDVNRILAPLEKLNPRGRGPLTKALREAAPHLGPSTARSTIILIHDGLDNCQQDPCSVFTELRAAHHRVRIDVVSVGLSQEDARAMSCLPQASGGRHYQVASAAEMDAAVIDSLARAAGAAPAPPPPPPSAPVASAAPPPAAARTPGRPGLQLWTTLVKNGPPLSAAIHWTVRRSGEKGEPLWTDVTPSPLLVLPTGRYDVEARFGLITKAAVAEAVEGQPRALGLVLDAGILGLTQTPATRSMLDEAVVTLSRVDAKGTAAPVILKTIEPEIALPPGNYLVSVTDGALRIERPVGIVAGESVSIANVLSLGVLELSATATRDGPPIDDVVYAIYEDDPDAPQGRREVTRSAAHAPHFKLPAGTYYVVARRGPAEARDRVAVRSGEIERKSMSLDIGKIAIAVRFPASRLDNEGPIRHRIQRLDVQPNETMTASGSTVTLDLAAGQYRVESRVGIGNVRAQRDIRLRPGETERISINHAAAGARFRMLDPASRKPLSDVSFEVRDPAGRPVWTGLGMEPRALLLAGRYVVRAEGRGLTLEQPFDLAAGEERTVEVQR